MCACAVHYSMEYDSTTLLDFILVHRRSVSILYQGIIHHMVKIGLIATKVTPPTIAKELRPCNSIYKTLPDAIRVYENAQVTINVATPG